MRTRIPRSVKTNFVIAYAVFCTIFSRHEVKYKYINIFAAFRIHKLFSQLHVVNNVKVDEFDLIDGESRKL